MPSPRPLLNGIRNRPAPADLTALRRTWNSIAPPPLKSQRQFQRLATAGFPMHQVGAAGVGQVVVGRAVGRVAPDPGHVEPAVGAERWAGAVGVHFALAAGQGRVDQAAPGSGFFVVDVVDVVAVAAAAVAVAEDQVAGGAVCGPTMFATRTSDAASSGSSLRK